MGSSVPGCLVGGVRGARRVDGAQHGLGLAPVADALRQNDVALEGAVTLRVPVLGLRVSPERFLDQVEAALRGRGWTG
jgi:hypothetical protein